MGSLDFNKKHHKKYSPYYTDTALTVIYQKTEPPALTTKTS